MPSPQVDMVQNWPLSLNEELQFTKLLAEGLIIIEPFPAIMPFVRPGRRRFVLLACNLSMGDELRSHEVGLDAAYGAQLCTLPQPKHVGHLIVLLKESLLSIATYVIDDLPCVLPQEPAYAQWNDGISVLAVLPLRADTLRHVALEAGVVIADPSLPYVPGV